MKDNRRSFIKKSASFATGVSIAGISSSCGESKKSDAVSVGKEPVRKKDVEWPISKGTGTPKLCVSGWSRTSEKGVKRKIKQLGVD